MRIVLLVGSASAMALAGCANTPAVTRTTARLGDVDMTGMECRTERPIASNLQRTVCARPEEWAALDKKEQTQSEELLDYLQTGGNGFFNRR
jgi:hypothetical protein